jgi:hypothetical protein
MQQENFVEKTKGDLMAIRRKITEAGRIQDALQEDLKRLEVLKKEVKLFITSMASDPTVDVTLVSGEYAAVLSSEAMQRETGAEQNRALFGLLGLDKFLDLATFKIPDMKKAVGVDQFDSICPQYYNGTGRRFSLKKKA